MRVFKYFFTKNAHHDFLKNFATPSHDTNLAAAKVWGKFHPWVWRNRSSKVEKNRRIHHPGQSSSYLLSSRMCEFSNNFFTKNAAHDFPKNFDTPSRDTNLAAAKVWGKSHPWVWRNGSSKVAKNRRIHHPGQCNLGDPPFTELRGGMEAAGPCEIFI